MSFARPLALAGATPVAVVRRAASIVGPNKKAQKVAIFTGAKLDGDQMSPRKPHIANQLLATEQQALAAIGTRDRLSIEQTALLNACAVVKVGKLGPTKAYVPLTVTPARATTAAFPQSATQTRAILPTANGRNPASSVLQGGTRNCVGC